MVKSFFQTVMAFTFTTLLSTGDVFSESSVHTSASPPDYARTPSSHPAANEHIPSKILPPASIREKDANGNFIWQIFTIPTDQEMRSGLSETDWAYQQMAFKPHMFYYDRERKILWKKSS